MQLSDYINREKGTKTLTKKHRNEIFEMKTEVKVLSKYDRNQTLKGVNDKLFDYGLNLVKEGYDVPRLGNTLDGLPMTHTKHARSLADRIGFLVMPLEYFSDGSMWRPSYDQGRHIEALGQHFDIFVMAPVHAYSLSKHIKAKDQPMFIPNDMVQAFTALGMSIPVFRSMQRQIDENQERTNRVCEQADRLKADVSSLKARLDALEEQAAAMRVHREEETRRVKLAEKQREEDEKFLLSWYASDSDPIVLALPHGKTIKDDTIAFIGPCWGKLPPRVVDILSLKSAVKRSSPKLLPK